MSWGKARWCLFSTNSGARTIWKGESCMEPSSVRGDKPGQMKTARVILVISAERTTAGERDIENR